MKASNTQYQDNMIAYREARNGNVYAPTDFFCGAVLKCFDVYFISTKRTRFQTLMG